MKTFWTDFQELPIKNKLIRLIMMISLSALFLAVLISAMYEIYLLKHSMTQNMRILASAIATNSTASVAFNDPVSAADILRALDSDENVEISAIYLKDKILFSYHINPLIAAQIDINSHKLYFPRQLAVDGHHFIFKNKRLLMDLYHPITVDNKRVATLFIRSNLDNSTKLLISFLLVMFLLMLLISTIVYLIASHLQKLITEPIHELAQTANLIADNKDYTIRMEQHNNDEIGLFINAFNEMIIAIQNHEAELSSHRLRLSSEVDARTRELAQERDKALAATKAKSQFLANMSHEIRTPMNAMIGMLSILETKPLPATEKSYLQTAINSSNSLLNLINDILDYSKIEAGKLNLEYITFNLCQLIQEVIALFIHVAQQKQIKLEYIQSKDINKYVKGDPTRLRQILCNLISNAIKFTDKGHVILSITLIEATEHTQRIEFSVSDTGIGIDEKDKYLLFQSFTQLDGSTTRKYGGTGLGLSVCKQLIELMGGKLDMQSVPGQGTLFWFDLFLDYAENEAEKCSSELQNVPTLEHKNHQAKILLVDDDPINQQVALAMLNTLKLSAETANNGQEALRRVQQQHFDIILMDCQMPLMDGYQATQNIRSLLSNQQCPVVTIIGMTANAMPEDKQKCLNAGMDDYLAKPINLQTFSNLMARWLTAEQIKHRETNHTTESHITPTDKLWNKQKTLTNLHNNDLILNKMITIFIQQYPAQLDIINQAINNNNISLLSTEIHKLKGSIANFHCIQITDYIQSMEHNIAAQDLTYIQREFSELTTLLSKLEQQLKDA